MSLFDMKTFSMGGIHVDDRKFTHASPIEPMPVPKEIVLPVSQHIGAPAKPLVKKGDAVKAGQIIAEKAGMISANIISSVSGTVRAVENRQGPGGFHLLSIVIDNDGRDEWIAAPTSTAPSPDVVAKTDVSGIVAAVEKAGIVGMGGATFPTSVKLSPPPGTVIDTVILNGVECEPYLTADARIMIEHADRIAAGLALVMKHFSKNGPVKGYIGIEANKPDAIEVLSRIAPTYGDIAVVPLALKYPQGGEKQLINALTGRSVPSGKLPSTVGCVVQNVATAAAIYDAVVDGRPLVDRVVTVTGGGVKNRKNLLVRLGTSFASVLEHCGGVTDDSAMLISGGPMMGKALNSATVPVTKGVSGILVLNEDEANLYDEQPCIRCGRCVEVCPMGLHPALLARNLEIGDYAKLEELGILDCIECGSCNYICAGHNHLVQSIRLGKIRVNELIRERNKKAEKK